MTPDEAVEYIQSWIELQDGWYVPSILQTTYETGGKGGSGVHTLEDLREELEWTIKAMASETPVHTGITIDADTRVIIRHKGETVQVFNRLAGKWATISIEPYL